MIKKLVEIAHLFQGPLELVALTLFLSTVMVYAVLIRAYFIDGCPG